MSEPDIDLREFPYMPLYIARLQKSKAWLMCKRTPELAFYMMNLWMRSWHEVPCGSLEDDDDVLADAAMCEPDKWPTIKDRVLRGWVHDGAGRIRHAVVTEVATESNAAKMKQRKRTSAATEARWRIRDASVTDNATGCVTDTVADTSGERGAYVTSTKGREGKEREGKGREDISSLREVVPALTYDDPAFAEFWALYPRKDAKADALKAWAKAVKTTSSAVIIAGLKRYRFNPDPAFQKLPGGWLRDERWLEQQTTPPRPVPLSELPDNMRPPAMRWNN